MPGEPEPEPGGGGDFHVRALDGREFDFDGEPGIVYNVLSGPGFALYGTVQRVYPNHETDKRTLLSNLILHLAENVHVHVAPSRTCVHVGEQRTRISAGGDASWSLGDVKVKAKGDRTTVISPTIHLSVLLDPGHAKHEGAIYPDPLLGDFPHLDYGVSKLAEGTFSGIMVDGDRQPAEAFATPDRCP